MLSAGELHIWQGTASRHTAYADWALLSTEEHERWRRLPPLAAAYYAASHAAARRILGRYLEAPPATLRLGRASCPACGRTGAGRPVVQIPGDPPGDPLWFSLSRSGPQWLLALGRHLIGVDIESSRPVDIEALETLALSGKERKTLADHDKADRLDLFFRCWTRKEAVFKASGAGRFVDLTNVDVQPERSDDVVVECAGRSGTQKWRVRSLNAGTGHYAAVATPADASALVLHREWRTL
ncbi:MAG TPA: 4'-phosphopantetheinyl transferase superfamily protein [Candidatus Limnocylindrales bacterium]